MGAGCGGTGSERAIAESLLVISVLEGRCRCELLQVRMEEHIDNGWTGRGKFSRASSGYIITRDFCYGRNPFLLSIILPLYLRVGSFAIVCLLLTGLVYRLLVVMAISMRERCMSNAQADSAILLFHAHSGPQRGPGLTDAAEQPRGL
jgi:hypothetical protein